MRLVVYQHTHLLKLQKCHPPRKPAAFENRTMHPAFQPPPVLDVPCVEGLFFSLEIWVLGKHMCHHRRIWISIMSWSASLPKVESSGQVSSTVTKINEPNIYRDFHVCIDMLRQSRGNFHHALKLSSVDGEERGLLSKHIRSAAEGADSGSSEPERETTTTSVLSFESCSYSSTSISFSASWDLVVRSAMTTQPRGTVANSRFP